MELFPKQEPDKNSPLDIERSISTSLPPKNMLLPSDRSKDIFSEAMLSVVSVHDTLE